MSLNPSIARFVLAVVTPATMSLAASAQTTPAGQDRSAVKAETRQAAAAGTLQRAGEAPDPVGGATSGQGSRHAAHAHHRSGHKTRHHARAMAHRSADTSAVQAQEPMTEPKK